LNGKGYYHSRSTIATTYVEPLVNVGLVQEKNSKYRLTLYGRRFKDLLSDFNVEDSLPPHARCYEENVLRKLKDGAKTHSDLAEFVPENSLSRTLQRLKERGLVSKSKSPCYILYFRTKKVPKRKFSPTEKRIYDAIPEVGVSVPELSEKVGINLRRTYKYLRRLRKRRLVFTRRRPRTYELTSSGRKIANFLEEAANLVLDASRASTLLQERSKQILAAPIIQC
jgi:predicted transcriptional regulator